MERVENANGTTKIYIAVIDTGVQLTHRDLNLETSLSYDVETGKSPSGLYGDHGTTCAGIICAKTDNGFGITGIAPNCPVIPISKIIGKSVDSYQKFADAFYYSSNIGASVISCSWSIYPESTMLNDAIKHALTYGRNGKGCVIVFASGNENKPNVSYPANSFDDIIVVGAITYKGERKRPDNHGMNSWGSNYGDKLDVVAPGIRIFTTTVYKDIGGIGLAGEGTSMACPHVAAIAGLILSVRPDLGQKEVGEIICQSAQKLIGYHGDIVPPIIIRPSSIGNKTVSWHQEVGYGMVNAYSALGKVIPGLYSKTINP